MLEACAIARALVGLRSGGNGGNGGIGERARGSKRHEKDSRVVVLFFSPDFRL